MRNISDKNYGKNQNTHFIFKNGAIHEIDIDIDIFVNCKWVDTRWQCPECNEHAPFFYLWPAPLYNIFPPYLIKARFSKNR